ncbi:hypothetical protein N9A38_02965 [Gammaproteobacteria bacterium]|nr:hypothetical protein [Gammaproteobacteria bacterium]
MNKIFPIILVIVFSGCSNHDVKFEKCADSMFLLTNELMKKRLPTEAKSTEEIEGFNSNTYSRKKEYAFYTALIKICELKHSEKPEQFDLDYK